MKKLLLIACAATVALGAAGNPARVTAKAEEEKMPCKAAYSCDYDSGTVVYAQNETARLPIASMCKIMTLLLSFEAAEAGVISYDEQITVSENAAGMGGSQVFLGANLSYTAEQLMKSVAVCSANDSCVALAERIAGSEAAFVAKMNERAAALGAENTLFANCTGLPKDPQYSCAKDVSAMLREMIGHQKYFEFSKVWLEDFAHPDGRTISMTNTNKLIRGYEGCDGGKTGFTNEAGFCIAATAKRAETRIVSVVIGADSSKTRFAATKGLLDYAFNCYENIKVLEAGKPLDQKLTVSGSKVKEVEIYPETALCVFGKKGNRDGLSVEYVLPETCKAPIAVGDEVGCAVLYKDGVEVMRTRLLSAQTAERYSWWDALRESARNWN